MTIKLRFDPHPEFPGSVVWTEDLALAPVAGMLESELQSAKSARDFAQRMKNVVSKSLPDFQGVGNSYLYAVSPKESELGLNTGDNPETITVVTSDLIAAVEEWAAHLEALSTRRHQ